MDLANDLKNSEITNHFLLLNAKSTKQQIKNALDKANYLKSNFSVVIHEEDEDPHWHYLQQHFYKTIV